MIDMANPESIMKRMYAVNEEIESLQEYARKLRELARNVCNHERIKVFEDIKICKTCRMIIQE